MEHWSSSCVLRTYPAFLVPLLSHSLHVSRSRPRISSKVLEIFSVCPGIILICRPRERHSGTGPGPRWRNVDSVLCLLSVLCVSSFLLLLDAQGISRTSLYRCISGRVFRHKNGSITSLLTLICLIWIIHDYNYCRGDTASTKILKIA
jgi:hypothetical protein